MIVIKCNDYNATIFSWQSIHVAIIFNHVIIYVLLFSLIIIIIMVFGVKMNLDI